MVSEKIDASVKATRSLIGGASAGEINRSIPKARGRQRETARQNRGGSHGKEETPPLEVAKSEEVTSLGTLDRRVTCRHLQADRTN